MKREMPSATHDHWHDIATTGYSQRHGLPPYRRPFACKRSNYISIIRKPSPYLPPPAFGMGVCAFSVRAGAHGGLMGPECRGVEYVMLGLLIGCIPATWTPDAWHRTGTGHMDGRDLFHHKGCNRVCVTASLCASFASFKTATVGEG